MPKKGSSEPSFEQLFSQLEAAVNQLEAGNLTLDASLALYERGMQLAKQCGEQLDHAELRITELAPALPAEDTPGPEEEDAAEEEEGE